MSLTASCCVSHKITQERSKDIKKSAQLVEKIQTLGGLSIQDRTYHLRRYRTCFVASELVDWFIKSGEASSRAAAIELGQLLVNVDYIHHVVDEHNFDDAYLFFRFRQDEPPENTFKGPSVPYLRGQEGVVISLLAKKRLVLGWTYYVYILLPSSKKMYQYRTELESTPLSCIELTGYSVQPESPPTSLDDDKGAVQRHVLHFYNRHKVKCLSLSADSSDVQLTWLRALETTDVQILPAAEEVEDLVKNAKSIYEFEAKDIDGNVVSLERYRGHVTLVVNVASA